MPPLEMTYPGPLPAAYDPLMIEQAVREYWRCMDILKITRERRADADLVGYVEGPPTLNGAPHVGHLRGRVIKDLWFRFTTMRGHRVIFRAGWDTQGLPVELEAEKELGLTGSKVENLRAVGEEALAQACKRIVHKYHRLWTDADERLGLLLDTEHAYFTYRDEYIEREWKYLEVAWSRGLLGEGFRVVAYCPSCQTSLSHAEVGLGYEVVEDPSVYFKARLEEENAYLVLWTTMPFTVVTEEMVGVNPRETYVYVRAGSDVWIVGERRLKPLMTELAVSGYNVLKRVRGAELEGKRYLYPLASYVTGQQVLHQNDLVHRIVAEDFVDVSTGSGLVHMSPANGEEDFEMAARRSIPLFNPIDDQLRFTHEAGVFAGLFVRDADSEVSKLLQQEGLLLKESRIRHEYPTCWRSHHKVVWMARRGYFYWLDRLGDLPAQAAASVEYFFEPPRNRFLDIVREHRPWCISRERVWGTPLPIWICEECRDKVPAFSRAAIVARATSLPDGPQFELHRPWIDRVVLKCPTCGASARREPFVLDAWHNSGAAPYAAFTDAEFDRLVPVPFLTEAIDQTRGWAYSLLIENVLLKNRAEAPYRAFLFQGHVLDERGNKMSKSLGNVIEALDILRGHSSDLVRYYYLWKAPSIDNLNFSPNEVTGRPFQVLNTLYHLHLYFQQNSQLDGYSLEQHTLAWARDKALLQHVDCWVLAHLQSVVAQVTEALTTGRYHLAARALEQFVIETLSQGYIPLTRTQLWDDADETRNRRLAIHAVLAHCLRMADTLLYPMTPYITEYLQLRCFGQRPAVILLIDWPKVDPTLDSAQARQTFDLLLTVVSIGSSARMRARVKRRWPLRRAVCVATNQETGLLQKHLDILREQLNVKEVELRSDYRSIPLALTVRPRLRVHQHRIRRHLKSISEGLASLDPYQLYQAVRSAPVSIEVEGRPVELTRDDLEFSFKGDSAGVAEIREGIIVFLDLARDPGLVGEGLMRDLARRLQALRKERGKNPADILACAHVAGLDPETRQLLAPHRDQLSFLVRVRDVRFYDGEAPSLDWADAELDGRPVRLALE